MIVAQRLTTVVLLSIASLVAHAEPAPKTESELSFDGLQRVESKLFALAWIKPDAHFAGYKKLLVLPAEIAYKDPEKAKTRSSPGAKNDSFLLSESRTKRLRKSLREAFEEQVIEKGGWELTDQPGPDVMIARGGLIDLIVRVPPATAGRSRIYLDSFGEATLVIELYDSQSREILARIADREAAEPPGNRMGTDLEAPGEVRRMFSSWAKRFREGLDHVREQRP